MPEPSEVFLGMVAASRRLRNAVGIGSVLLLVVGLLTFETLFGPMAMLFGGAGVVYWLIGSVLAWAGGTVAEDVKANVDSLRGGSIPEADGGEAQSQGTQTVFEPNGVLAGIPYKTLPNGMIEAMLHGGIVRFQDEEQFAAAATGHDSRPRQRQRKV